MLSLIVSLKVIVHTVLQMVITTMVNTAIETSYEPLCKEQLFIHGRGSKESCSSIEIVS